MISGVKADEVAQLHIRAVIQLDQFVGHRHLLNLIRNRLFSLLKRGLRLLRSHLHRSKQLVGEAGVLVEQHELRLAQLIADRNHQGITSVEHLQLLAERVELVVLVNQIHDFLEDGLDVRLLLVLLLELELTTGVSVSHHDLEFVRVSRILLIHWSLHRGSRLLRLGRLFHRLRLLIRLQLRDFRRHADCIVGNRLQAAHVCVRQLLAVAASLTLDVLRHVDGVIRDLLQADKNRLDDLIVTILLPGRRLLLLRLLGLHRSLLLWLALADHVRQEAELILSNALDLALDILCTADN